MRLPKIPKPLNQDRAIKLCLDCHDPLKISSNITEARFKRSEYLCISCKYIRAGSYSKVKPINQQLAHGMKIYRVKLIKLIDSFTGRVGRPPNLINELKLHLRSINRSIKKHEE